MFGYALLSSSFVFAALASILFYRSHKTKNARIAELGEFSLYASFSLTTASLILLIHYFVTNNFSVVYVLENSNRNLPLVLKFSAVWAGKEGSMLLWSFFSLLASVMFVRRRENAAAASILAAISAYIIAGSLIFNPFATLPYTPVDGYGLNPLLRTVEMVLHPPVIFAAYAFAAVPFAIHATGGKGADSYAKLTFLLLSLGIIIGGWWAYRTLGWGGFWGWDPVENASLLPWLSLAAYLHSKSDRRFFATLTFALVFLATFITRSGIVESPHAFAGSGGEFFLLPVVILLLLAAKHKPKFRDFCGASQLFLAMLIVVAMGTLAGISMEVDRTYYLFTFLPLFALAVVLILAKFGEVKRKLAVHLAVLLIFAGASAVWTFEKSFDLQLNPSDEAAGLKFEFVDVDVTEDEEKIVYTAVVNSDVGTFYPKIVQYKIARSERTVSSVEILSTPLVDYYLALEGLGMGNARAKFYIVPMINLVWLGSALLLFGVLTTLRKSSSRTSDSSRR